MHHVQIPETFPHEVKDIRVESKCFLVFLDQLHDRVTELGGKDLPEFLVRFIEDVVVHVVQSDRALEALKLLFKRWINVHDKSVHLHLLNVIVNESLDY